MKFLSTFLFTALASLALAQQSPKPLLLHFQTASAELSPQAKADLETALAPLRDGFDRFRVTVNGHTDSRGSSGYNAALSERRSQAVADFLASKGFPAEQVKVMAQGESRPAANNTSDEGMAVNRRVEVRFEALNAATCTHRNRVPPARLHFQAEKGIAFESPRTGTKVNIPSGVLVRQDGSRVSGEVELQFREYRSMADFLAAGIPMHYVDERGDFFFNSGGMFEVRTFQKGEALTVASGKSFTVTFAPMDELADANLFLFNDGAQRWDYVSSSAFAQPLPGEIGKPAETALPKVVSEADVVRNNTEKEPDLPTCALSMPFVPYNVSSAQWLMESVRTGAALAKGHETMPKWFRKYVHQSDAFFLASLENGRIELVGSVSGKFFPDDKNHNFPELRAFKDHYFESDSADIGIIGSLMKRKESGARPVPGEPAKLLRGLVVEHEAGSGNQCVLRLYDGKTEYAVRVRLRLSTEYAERLGRDDSEEVLASYSKLRAARRDDILDKINAWRRFLLLAPVFQTSAEHCMSTLQWLGYFDRNQALMRQRYDDLLAKGIGQDSIKAAAVLEAYKQRVGKDVSLRRAREKRFMDRISALPAVLNMNRFGWYNCDQVFRLAQNPEMIIASYQLPDGKPVQGSGFFKVIDRDRKIFFDLANQKKIYKIPGKRLDIVLYGSDGRIYYLNADDYAKLDFGTSTGFTFTLQDVTERARTPQDWSALLGI